MTKRICKSNPKRWIEERESAFFLSKAKKDSLYWLDRDRVEEFIQDFWFIEEGKEEEDLPSIIADQLIKSKVVCGDTVVEDKQKEYPRIDAFSAYSDPTKPKKPKKHPGYK